MYVSKPAVDHSLCTVYFMDIALYLHSSVMIALWFKKRPPPYSCTVVGPRNHVLDGVENPSWEGEILGIVQPNEKHWESVLRHFMQQTNR